MSVLSTGYTKDEWRGTKLLLFRTGLLFLLLLSVPFNRSYYDYIFTIRLTDFSFQDLFQLTHHLPGVYQFGSSGWASFAGWLLTLLVAFVAALIWQKNDRFRWSNDTVYEAFCDFARFRLSIGMLFYGILLLFALFFPAPALSDLHTQYGQFAPWKIYYHSSAIAAAGYIQTIGFFQVLGAVLLLWRRTTILGVLLLLFVLSNIVLANFAYSMGDHLQAVYLFLLGLFLLLPELPKLYSVLVLREKTPASHSSPSAMVVQPLRKFGIAVYAVSAIAFIALAGFANRTGSWPYSQYEQLPGLAGYYQVTGFTLNKKVHPFSSTDSLRWKDIVFEHGPKLSIRTNHPVPLTAETPTDLWLGRDPGRYLTTGNGDRSFYEYTVRKDSMQLLDAQKRTVAYSFQWSRPDSIRLELDGTTGNGEPINIVLQKIDKQYLLEKGRRKPIVIN